MKIYLCRKKRANLIIETTRTRIEHLRRTIGRIDLNLGVSDLAAFESIQFGDAAENWNLLSKLKNSEWMAGKPGIKITMEIKEEGKWKNLDVELKMQGALLDNLVKRLGRLNVKVAVQISLVNGNGNPVGPWPDCDFPEMKISSGVDGQVQGANCKESCGGISENLRNELKSRIDHLVNVEISLIITAEKKKVTGSAEGNKGDLECANVNKKLLMEEVRTDLEIIAENGKGVKCLSAFLVVQSEVIKAMLESNMRENKDGRILMEDVSEQGVRALLAYLYYRDLEMPLKSSVLAVELLEVSHRYLIGGLEDAVKRILLEKPVKWVEAKAAVRLFYFAGKLDNHQELRRKAVQVLQSKPIEVLACEEYRRLFQVEEDEEVEGEGGNGEREAVSGAARLQGVKELCDALLSANVTRTSDLPVAPVLPAPRTSPVSPAYPFPAVPPLPVRSASPLASAAAAAVARELVEVDDNLPLGFPGIQRFIRR